MGPSSDQIERQIAQVRGSMEANIVELRERSRLQVQRASRAAAIALGVGAAVGVAVVGGLVAYRLLRPPTAGERVGRLLPSGLARLSLDARHAGRRAAQRLSSRVPSVRLYIGDRQVGEEPAASPWERIAIRAAQAAGTAAAGALATRLLAGLTEAARNREGSARR